MRSRHPTHKLVVRYLSPKSGKTVTSTPERNLRAICSVACIAAPIQMLVGDTLFLAGLVMLVFTLLWPRWFYPFLWISLVLLLEPMNRWLGRQSFLEWLQRGDWRPIISLSLGALICGFFWELWNYWSFPKWIYHTPGAQFLHLFEMPLLGYGGYIPFALELYALKNFLWPHGPRLQL